MRRPEDRLEKTRDMRGWVTRPVPITNKRHWKEGDKDAVLTCLFDYAQGKSIKGSTWKTLQILINKSLQRLHIKEKPTTLNATVNELSYFCKTVLEGDYHFITRIIFDFPP